MSTKRYCIMNEDCGTEHVCDDAFCKVPINEGDRCSESVHCPTESGMLCINSRCRNRYVAPTNPVLQKTSFKVKVGDEFLAVPEECQRITDCIGSNQYCYESHCLPRNSHMGWCPSVFEGSLAPCIDGYVCIKGRCRQARGGKHKCALDNADLKESCYDHVRKIPIGVCLTRKEAYQFKAISMKESFPSFSHPIIAGLSLLLLMAISLFISLKLQTRKLPELPKPKPDVIVPTQDSTGIPSIPQSVPIQQSQPVFLQGQYVPSQYGQSYAQGQYGQSQYGQRNPYSRN